MDKLLSWYFSSWTLLRLWERKAEEVWQFDRVGYSSSFLLLLEGNFTLILSPSARNNLLLPGLPHANCQPGACWGLRCRYDWGEALAYHQGRFSFPGPYEIIWNK